MSSVEYTGMYVLDDGYILTNMHHPDMCAGRDCWLHNPSDHNMSEWPVVADHNSGLIARECEHGFKHPDPDEVAFFESLDILQQEALGELVKHECDGCCACHIY